MSANAFLHVTHQAPQASTSGASPLFTQLLQHVVDNSAPLRPALVGADSAPALETAVLAHQQGIAAPVLIGNPTKIGALAAQHGWNINEFEMIPAWEESALMHAAIDAIKRGQADSLVKGQIHTDQYMRGILARDSGLRQQGNSRVVHVFAMFSRTGGHPLLISDAAVNVQPDQTTLQQSLRHSVLLAQRLGIDPPRVAVLSATESVIESVPSSTQAASLVLWAQQWAAEQDVNADITGPLALDGAISPATAALKGIDHPVAGHANIIIVPDIVSGNVLFKSLVWFAGAIAAGIVLGASVPVVLTSRADPAEARLASLILAKIMRGS